METVDKRNTSATELLLESLRLPDTFTHASAGIKQPLRPTFGKLNRHRFSRVHPAEEFKYRTVLVIDKEGGREAYLAVPALIPLLGGMANPKILRLAVDNAGTPRLIAEPIPDPNGRPNLWNETMYQAIRTAEEHWTRIESDLGAGQYVITTAKDDLGEPIWPDQSMSELVMTCFRDRIIQDANHPLIRQLEGRI